MDENLTRLPFVQHGHIEIRKRENDSSPWMSYLRAEDWKRSIHREGKEEKVERRFYREQRRERKKRKNLKLWRLVARETGEVLYWPARLIVSMLFTIP